MTKKTCIHSTSHLIPEEIQNTSARICVEFLKELQSLGATPKHDGLELMLSFAPPKFKAAFLGHLEIFLTEAVRNMDIQACYDQGKATHDKARRRFNAYLAKRGAA